MQGIIKSSRRSICTIVASLILHSAYSSCQCISPQDEKNKLYLVCGRISGAYQKPIPSEVQFENMETKELYVTYTNVKGANSGVYILAMPGGRYAVKAEHPAYNPGIDTVIVKSDTTISMDLLPIRRQDAGMFPYDNHDQQTFKLVKTS